MLSCSEPLLRLESICKLLWFFSTKLWTVYGSRFKLRIDCSLGENEIFSFFLFAVPHCYTDIFLSYFEIWFFCFLFFCFRFLFILAPFQLLLSLSFQILHLRFNTNKTADGDFLLMNARVILIHYLRRMKEKMEINIKHIFFMILLLLLLNFLFFALHHVSCAMKVSLMIATNKEMRKSINRKVVSRFDKDRNQTLSDFNDHLVIDLIWFDIYFFCFFCIYFGKWFDEANHCSSSSEK